jgi:hypothetical protein
VNHHLPSLLYPQLLGLSMGIDQETLGLKLNQLPLGDIENFFVVPQPEEEAAAEKVES